jgi:putative membrane protein
MKVLILSVDRDDDFGKKAGLNSPFIGREENANAVMALGLKDAEDSDVNTVMAALSMYDEMLKKGEDVEVATICGDAKVGYQSDLVLTTQLENVLELVKPDRVILVSDGAEDEFIYPMVFSRVKVDSVRRVWVKQAPTVEGTYYIITKMMADDKMRKRIFTPLGLVLSVLGLFNILPQLIKLIAQEASIETVASMGWGMIALVLGLYMIFFAYRVAERVDQSIKNTGTAIRNGSQMIPFVIVSALLFIAGIIFAVDTAATMKEAGYFIQSFGVLSILLWMWTFSLFSYQMGKMVNHYLTFNKLYVTSLVVSVSLFAIAFILQAAFDLIALVFDYPHPSEQYIVFMVVVGFLLAGFSGLINMNMRNFSRMAKQAQEGEPEPQNYPEA